MTTAYYADEPVECQIHVSSAAGRDESLLIIEPEDLDARERITLILTDDELARIAAAVGRILELRRKAKEATRLRIVVDGTGEG